MNSSLNTIRKILSIFIVVVAIGLLYSLYGTFTSIEEGANIIGTVIIVLVVTSILSWLAFKLWPKRQSEADINALKEKFPKTPQNMFEYLEGLGNLPANSKMVIKLVDDQLIIDQVAERIFINKVIQRYKIKASDILAFDLVNTAELKNKSVVGRGVVGALLLGPVGALLGGMSGANQQKIKTTLAISYLSSNNGNPKTIILNAEISTKAPQNKFAATKIKNQLAKIPKSEAVMAHLGQFADDSGNIIL